MPELPAPPAELPAAADTTGGDTGNATVGGDTGSDTVAGDKGKDTVTGGEGNDTVSGGEGNDTVSGATVPEAYEIKVKDAEGKDADLDPELLTAATPVFKAAGLTNEQAQQIAQFYAGNVLPGVSQFIQQETLRLLGLDGMGEWAKQIKTDKDIGGAKYEENLTIIAQGRDAFATPELRAILETTRLGNHPEVAKLFFKLGKQVAEGKVHSGPVGGPAAQGVEAFYDPAFSPKS